MAKVPTPEETGRAAELREQINRILHRGPKNNQSASDVPERHEKEDVLTPREFIENRMRELDRKKSEPSD